MLIFSRPKKLTVDFITCDYKSYDYFPIDRSNKFIPQWWKDISQEYESDIFQTKANRVNTLKRCPGFMDVFRYSYTMPLWTSCEIIVDDRVNDQGYSISCADGGEIVSHDPSECGNFLTSNSLIHFKFHSPWLGYSTKKRDLLWDWAPATWNNPALLNKLMIPTAFRNFRGGTSTNIHSFMDSSKRDVLYLEAGVPMLYKREFVRKIVKLYCYDNGIVKSWEKRLIKKFPIIDP